MVTDNLTFASVMVIAVLLAFIVGLFMGFVLGILTGGRE